MKHLALLTAIYVLAWPSALPAQEEPAPEAPAPATVPAQPAPAPAEAAPDQPAPAPAPPAPAPPAAERPAPAPDPELLADERAESPQPLAVAAASGAVTIADFSFSPGTITIDQGDTVTWTNNGPTPHSATANDGSFDTGIFPAGQSRSHTFDQSGSFSYFCTPHPYMKGTVVVRASQTGGDAPDSSTGGGGDTSGADTAGTEASQADDGPALPNTGADAGALLLLGWLLLAFGWAVQRRIRTG